MESIDMDRLKTGEVNLGVRERRPHATPISSRRPVHLTCHPYPQTQTSIMAVQFDGGVIVGADSRTTTGSYIVRLPPKTCLPFQLTLRPRSRPTA
jgi:hypothetical protein